MRSTSPRGAASSIRVYRLAQRVLLLIWDAAATVETGAKPRAYFGRTPAPPPSALTTVETTEGLSRTVLAVTLPKDDTALEPIAIVTRSGDRVAVDSGLYRGQVIADLDPYELLGGLGNAARLRALRFVLETCGATFRLSRDLLYAGTCRSLIAAAAGRPGTLARRVLVTEKLTLCEGNVPAGIGGRMSAVIIGETSVRGTPFRPGIGSTRNGNVGVALILEESVLEPDSEIVLLGEDGLAVRRVEASKMPLDGVFDWLRREGRDRPLVRAYLARCLTQMATTDPTTAALLREIEAFRADAVCKLDTPSLPISAEIDIVAETKAGLLVVGSIDDRHSLVSAIEFVSAVQTARRSIADLAPFTTGNESREKCFVTLLPELATELGLYGLQPNLCLASGETIELPPVATTTDVLAAWREIANSERVKNAPVEIFTSTIIPTLAILQSARHSDRDMPISVDFGVSPDSPRASIIVPLSRDTNVARCQLSALAIDPALSDVEIIGVLRTPLRRVAAEAFLRDIHAAYGRPFRLCVPIRPTAGAALWNNGVALSRAPIIVFLSSTVVPDRSGWINDILPALEIRATAGIIALNLLNDDGSLAESVLAPRTEVSGGLSMVPLHAGFPLDLCGFSSGPVEAVSLGCTAVRRTLLDLVGGISCEYASELYLGADLSLKLREAGFGPWWIREPALTRFGTEPCESAEFNLELACDAWVFGSRWRERLGALPPAMAGAADSTLRQADLAAERALHPPLIRRSSRAA